MVELLMFDLFRASACGPVTKHDAGGEPQPATDTLTWTAVMAFTLNNCLLCREQKPAINRASGVLKCTS